MHPQTCGYYSQLFFSSKTSYTTFKRGFYLQLLKYLCHPTFKTEPNKRVFVSLCSHLHDSWRICRLWSSRLLLDVIADSNLWLDATDSLQGLLPAFLSLFHAGKGLQDGLHLPFFSRLHRVRCGVGRRGGWEEGETEALIDGVLLTHRSPEVAIQKVNVCYTAKGFLAECRDK